jgi:four helix bundle protein
MGNYQKLRVWEQAMDLVVEIYQTTQSFPREEIYGLTSQIRRAAVSVPSNIAEGVSRSYRKESLHHLSIAIGSLSELETQLILSNRLNYLSSDLLERLKQQCSVVGKQLNALLNSINSSTTNVN